MAVIKTTGIFSFSRSESGMRHSTASVSGFTPGGSGVGTPGLIGSLDPDRDGEVSVAVGVARALVIGIVLVVGCGGAVVSGVVLVVSLVVDGGCVVG